MTYTPGPWAIQPSLDTGHYGPPLTIIGPRHPGEHAPIIASISGAALHDPRHEANARLIAAAPDLLAALKKIDGLAERYIRDEKDPIGLPLRQIVDLTYSAIAKATGA